MRRRAVRGESLRSSCRRELANCSRRTCSAESWWWIYCSAGPRRETSWSTPHFRWFSEVGVWPRMERGRHCGGSLAAGALGASRRGPFATFAPNRAEQGGTRFRSSGNAVPTREASPAPRAHRSAGHAGYHYQVCRGSRPISRKFGRSLRQDSFRRTQGPWFLCTVTDLGPWNDSQ